MKVIEAENLSKTFRVKQKEKGMRGSIQAILRPQTQEIKAVNGVSFSVEEGEVLAFIGPNGAGKSTTIKMLTGILYPDGGKVKVLGIDPTKKRKQLAYEIGTVFGTDLNDPEKVVAKPSGVFLVPLGWERVGDVSNVVFTNGAVADDEGKVYIYYAASDTRMHVATTSIDKLEDYLFNTPEDALRSPDCVKQRCALIARNLALLGK